MKYLLLSLFICSCAYFSLAQTPIIQYSFENNLQNSGSASGLDLTFSGSGTPYNSSYFFGIGSGNSFEPASLGAGIKGSDFTDLDNASTATISAWFYYNSGDLSGNASNFYQIASEQNFMTFHVRGNGSLYFTARSNGSGGVSGWFGDATLNSSSTLSADQWNHVAMTFDNGVIKLYINGSEDASLDVSANRQSLHTNSTTDGLVIGKNPNIGSAVDFPAGMLIEEVEIYTSALSSSDILTKSQSSVTSPPIYQFSFDGDFSNTGSVSSADLTYNGPGSPYNNTYFYGSSGSSLDLEDDGTNTRTLSQGSDFTELDGVSKFSISAWLFFDEAELSGDVNDFYQIISESNFFTLHVRGNGSVFFSVRSTGSGGTVGWFGAASVSASASLNDQGVWNHIVATFDGGVLKLYVNGDLIATEDQSANYQLTSSSGTTDGLVIGPNQSSAVDLPDDMSVDQIEIYTRVLSDSEIDTKAEDVVTTINTVAKSRADEFIKVYPNPASTTFQVDLYKSESNVIIYSNEGNTLFSGNIADDQTFNANEFGKGLFYVQEMGSGVTRKLIIE